MDDDVTPRCVAGLRRPRRPLVVSLVVMGLLAAIGLLAAACGGGATDPKAASGGASSTSTTAVAPSGTTGSSGAGSSSTGSWGQANQSQQLQFAQCMRSNGVPNYPDPSASGGTLGALSAAGIDTHSASYQAALQACKRYTPAGNLTPAQSAADNAKGIEFAQCMRSHGVPNFPDPTSGPNGEPAVNLGPAGIDPNTPTFQAANRACQKVVPGAK
jgi:hypothetical protein